MTDNYEAYTPDQQKRAEIRENRIAALAFVGNAFMGRGDVSRYKLNDAYDWALRRLEEE